MPQQTIATYYETDHDRLDELFKNFQHHKRTDFAKAKQYFKEFKFGLQRHIVWEEEILFPLFEKKTGIGRSGPTEVMRVEHRMIGAYLEAIHEKVKTQNLESDNDEKLLLGTLFSHNQKEEYILYPAIDSAIVENERDGVFAEMQALPEERYKVCCAPEKTEHKRT
jgi:regulator of cell morphogenesis and NO signaling